MYYMFKTNEHSRNVIFKIKLIIILNTLLILVFNPISWFFLFDADNFIGVSNIIIISILDLLIVIFSILLIKTKKILLTIKIFCFNFFLLFILIIVCELVFGTWLKEKSIEQLWIPSNTSYKIDLKNIYENDSKYIEVEIDQYGFRGDYSSANKIDILTIGGSTTQQAYISDGYTWQDIIAENFKKNGQKISIVNAGVNGQSTFGHIKNFYEWFPLIPNLKPRYVLFYIGINDFYKHPDNDFDSFDLEKRSLSFLNKLERYSIFVKIYRTYRGNVLANAYGLKHDLNNSFDTSTWTSKPLLDSSDYDVLMKNNLDLYEERLSLLFSLVKELGAKPIFVTQTTRRYLLEGPIVKGEISNYVLHKTIDIGDKYLYNKIRYNGVDKYYMMKNLNNRTIRFAESNGAIVIDLAKDLQNEFDIYKDYYDAVHNTPSGTKKIGNYLYENLKIIF